MNVAIILAGGIGTRLGADIPKQFIKVSGKPLLVYTAEIYQNHPLIDAIEVVCVESHIDYLNQLVDEYNLDKVKWIIPGGKDFQHSFINGINNLKGHLNDTDIVLQQYGASPYITPDLITDAIKVSSIHGVSSSASPCYQLYGTNDDEKSKKAIDRGSFMELNCPHAYKFSFISRLLDEAVEKDYINQVEPHTTSLIYYMGHEIYFSKGSALNLKITNKEDLDLFEAYVLMKKQKLKTQKTVS